MPRSFYLSDAHMAAFSAQQKERFVREMMVYLKEVYPDETKKFGDVKLREIIETGIDKSKTYDIILERDVARYIEFMIAIAPDFDDSKQTPWAKEILAQRRATAIHKINQFYEHVMFGGSDDIAGQSYVIPRPLNEKAARQALARFHAEQSDLKGRRLTMNSEDATYRRRWIELYREAEAAL